MTQVARKRLDLFTAQALRARWLMRAVSGACPLSEGERGFHELAAGLFMVGYDLPPSP